jgi:hypothetical protein
LRFLERGDASEQARPNDEHGKHVLSTNAPT